MDNTGSIATSRSAMMPAEWTPPVLVPPRRAARPALGPVRDQDLVRDQDPVHPTVAKVLGRMSPVCPSVAGTRASPVLSRWQITRVFAHIATHFDHVIHTEDLAALVRLSPFHFSRVFRATFGAPPHRYISLTRVECAKLLMRDTDVPLGQIAAECGMADQAHFNKLFRRFVGTSPGAWRREARQ
jgi:AraC family transcriptional regulator